MKHETGTPLTRLNLSTMTYNALINAGIDTAEQAIEMDRRELEKIYGLGQKGITDIYRSVLVVYRARLEALL